MGIENTDVKCPFCGKMSLSSQTQCECGYYFNKEKYHKFKGEIPSEEPKLTYWQKVSEFANGYHHLQNLGLISLSAGYILGLFLGPFLAVDEKRIKKFEEKRDIVSLLNFMFTINRGYLWEKACQAIARTGPESLPLLIKALNPESKLSYKTLSGKELQYTSTPHIRASAAYCLGLIGDRSSLGPLEKFLNDKDIQVIKYVREAIEKIKEK